MNSLNDFYSNLVRIREDYYSNGAIGDSNTKLDEIAKLIAIYLYQIKTNASKYNIEDLIIDHYNNDNFNIVESVKEIFREISCESLFSNKSGESIFGSDPQLNIPSQDKQFTCQMLELISSSISMHKVKNKNNHKFDLLNEAFGHFIRENFRNNTEDAQYMTPPEVVDFMCNIVFEDIRDSSTNGFKILDPACGVGSFLVSFNNLWQCNKMCAPLKTYGQDKVERMVRLSFINMLLFEKNDFIFDRNNSLFGPSLINEQKEEIDLVLANPPFNAKINTENLTTEKDFYPLLMESIKGNTTSIDSELLFIDKSLSLLKENGRLLIIVPDSVISASGIQKILRNKISSNCTLRAIIELPSSTFAQAGTRVKTSILYLQKKKPSNTDRVFIAKSDSLGFDVSSRKGIKIKHEIGENDLPKIFEAYKKFIKEDKQEIHVLSDEPSAISLNLNAMEKDKWTPNHYHANRFKAISKLNNSNNGTRLDTLNNVADFVTKSRKKEIIPNDNKCISILHVINNSIIDYSELISYKPKYPGIRCFPGDVLVSKINPRIPRIVEVPDYNFPLTCSSEFEILKPKNGMSSQELIALLLLPEVQSQIVHLTSGASSSHRRVKSQDLEKVCLPIPEGENDVRRKISEYEALAEPINYLMQQLYNVNKELQVMMSE